MAQGFICAMLLLLHRPVQVSKRILAFILLTFLILSFKILLHTLGLWQLAYWRYLPLAFDLLIQPLFYIYALLLTQKHEHLLRKYWFHFIPTMLFFVHALWVYVVVQQTTDIYQKDLLAESLYYNRVKTIEDILSVISGGIYWFLSFRRIQAYKQWLDTHIADAGYPSYNWLRNVLIGLSIMVVLLMINISLDVFFNLNAKFFIKWQFFYFYLAVLVYYLGFAGYQQKDFEISFLPEKRSAISLDKQQIIAIKDKLLRAMNQEKVFLDAELNLQTLAKKIGVSETALSVVINNEFQKNFRNFINEQRIEEVKRKLNNTNYKHLSILGIALESGFNSEASFYRVFKTVTGQSPKDFMQKNNSQNTF